MIILRKEQKEYSLGTFITRNLVKGGKKVDKAISKVNSVAANPGLAVNKEVAGVIRNPIKNTLSRAETIADITGHGIVPVPGISVGDKVGGLLEKKLLNKGTRLKLARKSEGYMKSRFAQKAGDTINALAEYGKMIVV